MIPPFGFYIAERAACWLMTFTGAVGVVLTVTGAFETIGAGAVGELSPESFSWSPGRGWLIFQSLLVAGGGFGASQGRSFGLALAGIISALIVLTPVGLLAFLPGLWLSSLVFRRRRSFFQPRCLPPGRHVTEND